MKKTSWLVLVVGLFLGAACTQTVEAPAETEEAPEQAVALPEGSSTDDWVSIYDGETLAGWHPLTTAPDLGGKWEVVNGVIEGDQDPPGKGGFLVTDQKYRDFVVDMEVNLDYPTDSGVFLRMGEDGKSHQVTLDNVDDGEFGRIYLPWTQDTVFENPTGKQFFKQGEWNKVRVQIEGEPASILFWLNDELVTDFQHTAETTQGVPAEGFIAIQVHPGERWKEGNKVRFRNIRVKEL